MDLNQGERFLVPLIEDGEDCPEVAIKTQFSSSYYHHYCSNCFEQGSRNLLVSRYCQYPRVVKTFLSSEAQDQAILFICIL